MPSIQVLKPNIVGVESNIVGDWTGDNLDRTGESFDSSSTTSSSTTSSLPSMTSSESKATVKDKLEEKSNKPQPELWLTKIKIIALILIWLAISIVLSLTSEKTVKSVSHVSIPPHSEALFLVENLRKKRLLVEVGLSAVSGRSKETHWLKIGLQLCDDSENRKPISSEWTTSIPMSESGRQPEIKKTKIYELTDSNLESPNAKIMIVLRTTLNQTFSVSLAYDTSLVPPSEGITIAAILLVTLYLFIIFEIVHRTLAAVLAAMMSVCILALYDAHPTKDELISWIGIETLLLLFSMMALVAILSETGVFDYLAVLAYKLTNGRIWPLIDVLCLFTAILSSFLDNVTTSLLMTPVTIRLCETMELNPVPILMAMIMYSNIGGALTPIGDPPNVIIATNKDIMEAGVTFGSFLLHMGTGLVIVMALVRFQLRFMFRNEKDLKYKEPRDIQELRHEIIIWERAAASLSSFSKEEDLVKKTLHLKVEQLNLDLKKRIQNSRSSGPDKYSENLKMLIAKYPIRDKKLLMWSSHALLYAVFSFFFNSFPSANQSLGLPALLAVLFLLLGSNRADIEPILARIEWGTLIFFMALFILMEALARLGLIEWIGQKTEQLILTAEPENRLAVAILVILWVSALASSFVDNIPLTTMMVKIVISLGRGPLGLPLPPLVWSLAMGACLGGNGTLIGASSNVVCAGVAEQHGYRFSFMQFLKVGLPVMLSSVAVSSIYLLTVHVGLGWNI